MKTRETKKDKRIRIIEFIAVTIMLLLIIMVMLTSCTEDSNRDKCAILETGTVLLRNSTEGPLIADVTYNGLGLNNPITLHYLEGAVNVTYFQDIPMGRAVVWWRVGDEEWRFEFIEVESCQETYFEIQEP